MKGSSQSRNCIILSRYLAVCHPIHYRKFLTSSGPKTRMAKFVVPVVVAAVALNVPKFMEIEVRVLNLEIYTRLDLQVFFFFFFLPMKCTFSR